LDSFSIVMRVPFGQMALIEYKIINKYELEIIEPEKAEKLLRLVYPWRRREFKQYFKNNSVCLVGKKGDQIVSYGWNSIGKVDPKIQRELDLNIPMGPKDIWGVDIVVAPPYRGRGVGFSAFQHVNDYWKAKGMEYLYDCVSVRNRGSLKLHKRVGFKPIYIHYLHRWFGFQKSNLMPIDEHSISLANKAAKGINIGFLWK